MNTRLPDISRSRMDSLFILGAMMTGCNVCCQEN